MNDTRERLIKVAKETKTALYGEWYKKKHFDDRNNFFDADKGIFAEAMGLTSVMLLYNCFAENKAVYAKSENDPETQEIVTASLEYIYDVVHNEGYTIAPLRSAEDTRYVINKENAYTDTLTWVLSSSVLIVYAIRQGYLSLDAALETKAIELMADSLAYLLKGQLDCGAWGFSTHPASQESLYFTYAAAASLADFLDYILGELEYYADDGNQSKPVTDFYDWQTVNAINNYYKEYPKAGVYPTADITEVVAAAKSKLQMWLLENCLPLLPKIAECMLLTKDEMKQIGMAEGQQVLVDGKNYINLYYVYYIIDILTTSSSDKRYQSIIAGNDEVTADALKKALKATMNTKDYEYFFEKSAGKYQDQMFNDYINQSIHSARKNFGIARRTGKEFWDDNMMSELQISWRVNGQAFSQTAIDEARGDAAFTEPALVPMALRANTVYCYYIIERADATVDQMFDLICDDRSKKTEAVRKNNLMNDTIKDLWDKANYSLPVTERAIEAIVDYSDYLDQTEEAQIESSGGAYPKTIDEAIDKKIEQFLMSEEGSKLLEAKGYVHSDDAPASVITEDDVNKMIDARVDAIVNRKLDQRLEAAFANVAKPQAQSSHGGFTEDELLALLQMLVAISSQYNAAGKDKIDSIGAQLNTLLETVIGNWMQYTVARSSSLKGANAAELSSETLEQLRKTIVAVLENEHNGAHLLEMYNWARESILEKNMI